MSAENVNVSKEVSFLWEIADDLRGSFKQYEFQDIILPFIVLRRLEIRLKMDEMSKFSVFSHSIDLEE